MTITLAVVIPNYNDGKFISRCVRSVMNQSVAANEVIVVDDCSTDDSIDTIQALAAEFPTLRVMRLDVNQGVYGAIAKGRATITSEYVMFLSANDFLLQGQMARAKKCLALNPGVGLWSSMGWWVDEEDQLLGPIAISIPAICDQYFSPLQCRELAHRFGSWFAGPSVVYNNKVLEGVGAFNAEFLGWADLICALKVAGKAGAVFSPQPFVALRRHSGSYLFYTLLETERLLQVIKKIVNDANLMAPELFNSRFAARTIRRFVFTAINTSRAKSLLDFSPVLTFHLNRKLRLIQTLTLSNIVFIRIAMAFVVLRYFDIIHVFWNRILLCRIISFFYLKKFNYEKIFIYKKYSY